MYVIILVEFRIKTAKSYKNAEKDPKSYDFRSKNGAAIQIRTGDLILTKDALYQLSYSSTLTAQL